MINTPTPQESSPVKERCPIDGHAAFFFIREGLSYRCRHCKREHVVRWDEILQRYAEMRKKEE